MELRNRDHKRQFGFRTSLTSIRWTMKACKTNDENWVHLLCALRQIDTFHIAQKFDGHLRYASFFILLFNTQDQSINIVPSPYRDLLCASFKRHFCRMETIIHYSELEMKEKTINIPDENRKSKKKDWKAAAVTYTISFSVDKLAQFHRRTKNESSREKNMACIGV